MAIVRLAGGVISFRIGFRLGADLLHADALDFSGLEPISTLPGFEDREEWDRDHKGNKNKSAQCDGYFQVGAIKMEEFIDPRTYPWTEKVGEPRDERINIGEFEEPPEEG